MTENAFDLWRRQQRHPIIAEGDDWVVTNTPDLGRVLTIRTKLGLEGRTMPKKQALPKN